MENSSIAGLSPADLAYLGDAVFEVMVRERLVIMGHSKSEHLSDKALAYVTAKAQSEALSRIEALFDEDERDIYHRARNNHHTSNVPKSATPAQYRRATGLEAVFGYLYIKGKKERLDELFAAAFPKE